MRRAARTDKPQPGIVSGLRRIGASVAVTAGLGGGFPDLLVCWNRNLHLLEVKDRDQPAANRALTPDEVAFHASWKGQIHIVHDLTEALEAIGAIGQ